MEVEPPAQSDLAGQAKMEQEMQAKFDQQFEEMKAMLQGVAANQQAQGEALAKVNSTVSEQMMALATIRGEAQEASRLARSLQDTASGKAGLLPMRAGQGAAASVGPSLTDLPKAPVAPP
eukprot:9490527-Pyramimonas_sp.AAC.1